MEVSHCVDAALTRARQARLPSPWTEAVDFLCFPQSRARQCLTFLLARAPRSRNIDSLWTGRGIRREKNRNFSRRGSVRGERLHRMHIGQRLVIDAQRQYAYVGRACLQMSVDSRANLVLGAPRYDRVDELVTASVGELLVLPSQRLQVIRIVGQPRNV